MTWMSKLMVRFSSQEQNSVPQIPHLRWCITSLQGKREDSNFSKRPFVFCNMCVVTSDLTRGILRVEWDSVREMALETETLCAC